MCGCRNHLSPSAALKPPRGLPLGLKEGNTWIGRGAFEASARAQLLCSRRQACIDFTGTDLRLECHGCNPVYFVVCQSKNFYGTEATPAAELFKVPRGQAVLLADGDQFYFAGLECLLTVVLRHSDIVSISRDVPQSLLQQAPEVCLIIKEGSVCEEHWVADEQQVVNELQEDHVPAEEFGIEDTWKLPSKDEPVARASTLESMGTVDTNRYSPQVAGLDECNASVMPFGGPTCKSRQVTISKEETLFPDQEVAHPRGEVTNISLSREDVSRLDVQPFSPIVMPQDLEEAAVPAVVPENYNGLHEGGGVDAENHTRDAWLDNGMKAGDEVMEDIICSQLPIKREESRPLNDIRGDAEHADPISCSRGVAPGLEAQDYPPFEVGVQCEPVEETWTEIFETVSLNEREDGRLSGDALHGTEAQTVGFTVANDGQGSDKHVNLNPGQAGTSLLPEAPVTDSRDDALKLVEPEAPFEEASRAHEKGEGHQMSSYAPGDPWPEGPVEGMEPVIASLSGYEGLDRNKLVKLINKTGAAFTGDLSKANTHLVCRSFRGKKFNRAIKLHKIVVNHQWFEDCLRAGKRIPEEPYKLRSGEDVGPLKWEESLPSPATGMAQMLDRATNQQLDNHTTAFSSIIDQEVQNIINEVLPQQRLSSERSIFGNVTQVNRGQEGQHKLCATTSSWKNFPGTSEQTGLTGVGAEDTRGKKSSRLLKRIELGVRIDPVGNEQENLVRGDATIPQATDGRAEELCLSRVNDFVEQGRNTRRRKSPKTILRIDVDGLERDAIRSPSSINNRIGNLRGKERARSFLAEDEPNIINLSDDVDNAAEIGSQSPQVTSLKRKSSQITQDSNADCPKGRSSESIQCSQRDREVACAICLVEAKSPIEGLLECGHKFCYKCIFTWTIQAVKTPSCPLCKAMCDFITKQELSLSGAFHETVVVVSKKEKAFATRSSRTVMLDAVCIHCGNCDSADQLMRCGTCGDLAVHSFCLDPPVPPPWFCAGCTNGNQRLSMRLAWNEFLPGSSTADNEAHEVERPTPRSASNTRRRRNQYYGVQRPSRPASSYRPSLHAQLMHSTGPVPRRNVVGQHSLHAWLSESPNGGS